MRVSTLKQGERFSLKAEEELLSWKDKYHPSKTYVYVDNGKSGRKFTNRKIKKITELKEKGLIDEVWERAVDRLGRGCYDLARFFVAFMLAGGVIRTQTGEYTKNPLSLINFTTQAFAAEIQNNTRIGALESSYGKLTREGKWPYRAPTGFQKTTDDRLSNTDDME